MSCFWVVLFFSSPVFWSGASLAPGPEGAGRERARPPRPGARGPTPPPPALPASAAAEGGGQHSPLPAGSAAAPGRGAGSFLCPRGRRATTRPGAAGGGAAAGPGGLLTRGLGRPSPLEGGLGEAGAGREPPPRCGGSGGAGARAARCPSRSPRSPGGLSQNRAPTSELFWMQPTAPLRLALGSLSYYSPQGLRGGPGRGDPGLSGGAAKRAEADVGAEGGGPFGQGSRRSPGPPARCPAVGSRRGAPLCCVVGGSRGCVGTPEEAVAVTGPCFLPAEQQDVELQPLGCQRVPAGQEGSGHPGRRGFP